MSQLSEAVPLAIAPMFGECLVNFWIEHVVALGARHVIIIAADRPERVRAVVGDGRRWGVHIEFVSAHVEPEVAEAAARHRPEGDNNWLAAPYDIVVMNHLPELNALPLFDSYAGWFAALQAWIPRALTPSRVRVSEVKPGVWVGSGARIAPSAKLQGPCWIGDHVTIEAGAIVGPNAILEDRAVIDAGATIANSVVGPDTFVGRMMSVSQSLASGSLLINWRNESVLRVPDPFLMCSLVDMPSLMPDNSVTRAAVSLARLATKPLTVVTALFSGPNRADGAKLSR